MHPHKFNLRSIDTYLCVNLTFFRFGSKTVSFNCARHVCLHSEYREIFKEGRSKWLKMKIKILKIEHQTIFPSIIKGRREMNTHCQPSNSNPRRVEVLSTTLLHILAHLVILSGKQTSLHNTIFRSSPCYHVQFGSIIHPIKKMNPAQDTMVLP